MPRLDRAPVGGYRAVGVTQIRQPLASVVPSGLRASDADREGGGADRLMPEIT